MQQIAREANTKFWGIGQSFVTLTLRFDMHDIRAFGRENWPLYAYMAQKKHLAGWQTAQRERKAKRLHHSKSIYPFFSRSHCVDAIQQGVFLYHVTVFCKRPIPGSE